MHLYLNATSPYARLVRIVLLEKGLVEAVKLHWCDPWADDPELLEANPAGRIPALITTEGTTLSESLLIALYLDHAYPQRPLFPADRLAEVLHLAGLGQNLMDAAFNSVIARKHRGDEADSSVLGKRRHRAIKRILEQLNCELGNSPTNDTLSLGDIATAGALDYLAFRLPEVAWEEAYPGLAAWHGWVIGWTSFRETAFV
ncbi:glutathione S-transferase family protein [Halomonas sp. HNIBRBA4712]|uniref:glutathione S-transferase family protein n=1 Tax=Halomonas sp. HNIBRBA4712 TaxID=3373087 RepID=UPI0037477A49